jgi:putative membrane protein
MADNDDPRIYFAAERTLLAWVRTGLTVIGLGFVVARFGLFLRLMRDVPDAAASAGSTWIGVGLVVLGSTAIGVAAWQHERFWHGLGKPYQTRPAVMRWSVVFAAMISLIGLALGVYLVTSANEAEASRRTTAVTTPAS